MGYTFKRRRLDPVTGEPRVSAKWYFRYRDADGRERTKVGCTDRAGTMQKMAALEQAARAGVDGDAMERWRRVPLTRHVEAFATHLRASGCSPRYVSIVRSDLLRGFRQMGARVIRQVTRVAVEGNLLRLLDEGKRYHTRNHRVTRVKMLLRWGAEEGRWEKRVVEMVAKIPMLKPETDPGRRRRRALTVTEFGQLVQAARERPRAEYQRTHPAADEDRLRLLDTIGQERALAYQLAARVGLRRGEVRELRWVDVKLSPRDKEQLTVTALVSKSKRTDTLPLPPSVAQALADWRVQWAWLQRRPPRGDDLVFAPRNTGTRVGSCVRGALLGAMRKDIAYADELEYETAEGVLDFHALRYTFVTWLCRAGAMPRQAQELARHANVQTTMRIYAQVAGPEKRSAMLALDRLTEGDEAGQHATGTGG